LGTAALGLEASTAKLSHYQNVARAFEQRITSVVSWNNMAFPIKICSVCQEEFELKPDKPGFADRCPACSTPEKAEPTTQRKMDADERKTVTEANAARRQAMRDLLYRKDS
jgi:hypothetical protein